MLREKEKISFSTMFSKGFSVEVVKSRDCVLKN